MSIVQKNYQFTVGKFRGHFLQNSLGTKNLTMCRSLPTGNEKRHYVSGNVANFTVNCWQLSLYCLFQLAKVVTTVADNWQTIGNGNAEAGSTRFPNPNNPIAIKPTYLVTHRTEQTSSSWPEPFRSSSAARWSSRWCWWSSKVGSSTDSAICPLPATEAEEVRSPPSSTASPWPPQPDASPPTSTNSPRIWSCAASGWFCPPQYSWGTRTAWSANLSRCRRSETWAVWTVAPVVCWLNADPEGCRRRCRRSPRRWPMAMTPQPTKSSQ